jgi:hypothetical protein
MYQNRGPTGTGDCSSRNRLTLPSVIRCRSLEPTLPITITEGCLAITSCGRTASEGLYGVGMRRVGMYMYGKSDACIYCIAGTAERWSNLDERSPDITPSHDTARHLDMLPLDLRTHTDYAVTHSQAVSPVWVDALLI